MEAHATTTTMSKDLYDRELPPPHPGEILREDLLPRSRLSRAALARHLGISLRALTDLLAERRPVTLDLALRLGAALGSGARYWLGLQIQHDLWRADHGAAVEVKPVVWPRPTQRSAARDAAPRWQRGID